MEVAATVATVVSTLYPFINKLGRYVDSNFGGDVTAEEMINLNDFVRYKITAFIRTAELDHSDQLMPLLKKLQAAAFEAEDLLDLYEYKQIKNQVSSSSNRIKKCVAIFKEKLRCTLPKSSLRISLENLLKFVNKVEEIYPSIKSMTDLTLQNYKGTQASSSNPTTSTLLSPYFGRAKQIDNIIETLLDESLVDSNTRVKSVPIISIRGMRGSGKTVTAQCIFKDVPVNAFDLKMWVHVARNFDVKRLTKEIIESAKKGKCDEIANLDTLQTNLKECISHRKFLLVLDDVWCAEGAQWDLLLGPLNEVEVNGSKIIITTRMEQIASTLRAKEFLLEELEAEDCWSILKHYAFGNSEERIEDQALVNVGNHIISKVKSSPLALKIAGSSLREQRNINEWENILKQDMLKGTMDLLLFSFQHLPSHLQRCFAYCSLFPKGFQFTIFPYYHEDQLLIPLWIAQGYVENYTSELTLEEKGSIYIKELISYSFFEKRCDEYFVIHDLLHDLVENVSKGQCHRIENHESLKIPTACIHLSIHTEESHDLEVIDALKFKNLRTLIIFDPDVSEYIFKNKKNIFSNLIKLRALYIDIDFGMYVISGPHLDKLKHLRYLHVSFDEKLPRSLTKLYHLQFCDLMDMIFCIEKGSVNGMMPLKNLPLCGSLSIVSIENIKNKEEAAKEMLNKKKNLNELTLEWSNNPGIADNSSTCKEVLDALEPPPRLETLGIEGYQGVKVANWMMKENWLPRLQTLYLMSCKSLKEIPFLPPRLVKLHVKDCDELLRLPPVGNTLLTLNLEDCLNITNVKNLLYYASLEELFIQRCPMIKIDEPLLVEGEAEGTVTKRLPNLKFIMTDVPLLVVLVLVQQQTFSSITMLRLDGLRRPFQPLLEERVYQLISLNSLFLNSFTTLPNLENLTSLDQLYIDHCRVVESLPNMPMSLKELRIYNCAMLTTLPNLEKLTSLKILSIEYFNDVESLSNMPLSLKDLNIVNCAKLTILPNLEKLTSLLKLWIGGCHDVESLSNMPMSLQFLLIYDCPKLTVNYEEGGRLRHTISHIPNIYVE